MNKKEYVEKLEEFGFPRSEYMILSGGSMLLRGLREETADFDLCVSKALADKLDLSHCPQDDKGCYVPFSDVEMTDGLEGRSYDIIDGFKCETLGSILAFKRKLLRPKDLRDIEIIEAVMKEQRTGMKTLIVYYSLEGNTKYAADKIAEKTGADTLRLIPKKAYKDKGVAKFLWGGKSALMAESPDLEEYSVDLSAYDRVVFGFPVWASNFTPPIRTFVNENRELLKGKRLSAFACQSGSGAEKALARLAKSLNIEGFGSTAVFIDPKSRPDSAKDEAIDRFCSELVRENNTNGI